MNLYGIPYMGSKTAIAEELISILPSGKRFVDLFGGGFAMSHCAIMSGKYNKVYYNELNPLLVELIKKAIAGHYSYERFKPEFITREKFAELKDKDGYIKYIWSFGNKGGTYMFGSDIEEQKKAFHNAVVFGDMDKACQYVPELINIKGKTIKERRLSYSRIIKEKKERCDLPELTQLERLQNLQELTQLERLPELNCGSYVDYSFKEGDVVYCDPPYEGTAEYEGGFNYKEFYEWVATRHYKVYFSSYEISDKRFYNIWQRKKLTTLSASNNNGERIETLYCNKADKITLF